MVVDALAPWVARSSAAMKLNMHTRLVLREEGFQLPVSWQCAECGRIIKIVNTCLCFWWNFSMQRVNHCSDVCSIKLYCLWGVFCDYLICRADSRFAPSQWETTLLCNVVSHWLGATGADSRFAPSQWEMVLLCNDVSHWLGASLESTLDMVHIICSLLLCCMQYCVFLYCVIERSKYILSEDVSVVCQGKEFVQQWRTWWGNGFPL